MASIYSGRAPQHSTFDYFVRLILVVAVIAAVAWWFGDLGGSELKVTVKQWLGSL